MGQFSPIDPRCPVSAFVGSMCPLCKVTYIRPGTWYQDADMLSHPESCSMHMWVANRPAEAMLESNRSITLARFSYEDRQKQCL